MPARRAADHGDLRGVDVVFFGVGPEPADGALAVLHRRRERRLADQPVTGRGHHVPLFGVRRRVEMVVLPLAALPRAAVDEEQRRHRLGDFRRPVQVELQRVAAGVSVLDVLLQHDAIRQRHIPLDDLQFPVAKCRQNLQPRLVAGRRRWGILRLRFRTDKNRTHG